MVCPKATTCKVLCKNKMTPSKKLPAWFCYLPNPIYPTLPLSSWRNNNSPQNIPCFSTRWCTLQFAQHLSAPKLKFTGSSRPEGYTAQPRSWGSTGRVSTRAELNCTEYLEEGEDHDPQNTQRLQTCNIYGDVCAHSYQYDMYIYIYTRVCVCACVCAFIENIFCVSTCLCTYLD